MSGTVISYQASGGRLVGTVGATLARLPRRCGAAGPTAAGRMARPRSYRVGGAGGERFGWVPGRRSHPGPSQLVTVALALGRHEDRPVAVARVRGPAAG